MVKSKPFTSAARAKKALPIESLATVTGGGAIWNTVPADPPRQDGAGWE